MDGRCAIVGGASPASSPTRPCATAASSRRRSPSSTPIRTLVGAWLPRGGDPAAPDALRERRPLLPEVVPRARAPRGAPARSLTPLVLTAFDEYRPTLDEFLRHVRELREQLGWDESVRRVRAERVRAVDGGFAVDGRGTFRHVLLAPGHPGLARPPELVAGSPRRARVRAAGYARSVAVVGAGMAAATEWLNRARRRRRGDVGSAPGPRAPSLNVPRQLFSRRGLARFHAAPRDERRGAPRAARRAVVPARPGVGRSARPRPSRGPLPHRRVGRRRGAGDLRDRLPAGFREDPLLARLVDEHGLETEGRWLVLADDATVAPLTDGRRTLAVSGPPAQWAYPAADTLVGMKYVARRFLRRVLSCPTR